MLDAVSTEGETSDGGFAAPAWWQQDILQAVLGPTSLAGRCAPVVMPRGMEAVVPVDEVAPWQTTGGVQVYFADEAEQVTVSQARLGWQLGPEPAAPRHSTIRRGSTTRVGTLRFPPAGPLGRFGGEHLGIPAWCSATDGRSTWTRTGRCAASSAWALA